MARCRRLEGRHVASCSRENQRPLIREGREKSEGRKKRHGDASRAGFFQTRQGARGERGETSPALFSSFRIRPQRLSFVNNTDGLCSLTHPDRYQHFGPLTRPNPSRRWSRPEPHPRAPVLRPRSPACPTSLSSRSPPPPSVPLGWRSGNPTYPRGRNVPGGGSFG